MADPQRRQKRQKTGIVYKEDPNQKAAELEEFLFGAKSSSARIFERTEPEGEDDDMTLADLMRKQGDQDEGGGPLFFEDRAGGPAAPQLSDDEESDEESEEGSGSGSSGSDSEGGDGGGNEGGAASSSQSEESEDEGGDGDKQRRRAAGAAASGAERSSDSSSEDEEPTTSGAAAAAAPHKSQQPGKRVPVWSDPADAEVSVNLASKARLRKLRASHGQQEIDGASYEGALRKQHNALNPRTSWARLDGNKSHKRRGGVDGDDVEAGSDEGEEGDIASFMGKAGGLVSGRPAKLPPGKIETTRVKDANQSARSNAVIQSIGWHPSGQLLLTAGLDKKLRLFQVDGLHNPLVQSVHLADCPIQQAAWASGGSQIIAAGRRPHFYLYNVETGRIERVQGPSGCKGLKSLESFAAPPASCSSSSSGVVAFLGDQGYVPLVSLASRQWVANLKMNGSARCAAFTPDGNELLTLGSDSVVYTWDLRTRRCLSQMSDHGNVSPSSLTVSEDGRFFATGSESGVVNVYRRDGADAAASAVENGLSASRAALKPKPLGLGDGLSMGRPLKEIMNLTTKTDTLTFSPDSQILAIASRMKKDAMRLVHMPSLTVFSNWPSSRSPLHYVHSLAFSPHGGFLAVGNARGRVLLYRLHHYSQI